MRIRTAPFVFAVVLAAWIARAQVQRTSAALSYVVDPSTENCPDERSMRDAVARRLGYDPFEAPPPSLMISATIRPDRRGLLAVVQTLDSAGQVAGSREILSPRNDCAELASSLALSISIAIDPFTAARAEPPPASASASASASQEALAPPVPAPVLASSAPIVAPSVPVVVPPPPSPARESDPVSVRATAGALVAWGSEPAATGGFALSGGIRWQWISLSLEGRADLPASKREAAAGRVKAFSTVGSLVPCGHSGVIAGCALLSGGVLHGTGSEVDRPRTQSTPFAAVGVRAAAELPVSAWLAARIHLDLTRTLTPTDLEIDGRAVWSSPPVAAAAGLGAAATF